MKLRLTTPSPPDFRPIRITVLYQDLSSALRANVVLNEADAGNMNAETEFWRFDFLNQAGQRKAAVRMAARSRLVVLSARDQNGLGAEVEDCINTWLLGRRRGLRGFVLLLADANSGSMRSRLLITNWWRAAKEQGMEFYCDLPEWRSHSADLPSVFTASVFRTTQRAALLPLGDFANEVWGVASQARE
jgi:hypothetical protein